MLEVKGKFISAQTSAGLQLEIFQKMSNRVRKSGSLIKKQKNKTKVQAFVRWNEHYGEYPITKLKTKQSEAKYYSL